MIERKTDIGRALEDRFILKTLSDIGQEALAAAEEQMSSFSEHTKGDRSFATGGNNTLIHRHMKRHRFIDMNSRQTQNGKIKKKSYPIHNKILYGFAGELVKRLSFGFTQEVKKEMMKLDGTQL